MNKCSSNHKSHRNSKKEGNLHIPFIYHRVTGEAMVIWILLNKEANMFTACVKHEKKKEICFSRSEANSDHVENAKMSNMKCAHSRWIPKS